MPLLGVVVLMALTGVAAAAETGAARAVRVGVYQNKPKVFLDETGAASGLFVELLAEIARAEHWTLAFVPCEWNECLRALESGQIDLMPDVAYSRERERRYSFLRTPVFESWSQLYCRSEARIPGWHDLDGKRVSLLRGSIQQKAFEQMVAGLGVTIELVPAESLEQAFQAVQDGTADVAIANHFFGEYFHRQYGLDRAPIVFQVSELHYVTARGQNLDLLEVIERHLESWRGEPNSVYYATLDHWMDRPPLPVVPERVLWAMVIGFGLLLVASGVALLLRFQVRARTQHLLHANEKLARADEALRRSEAILNRTERLSRVGGWEWDLENRTMTWTDEVYRIHGFVPGELPSGSPDHIVKSLACYEPEAREAVRKAFDECCEHGTPYDLEVPLHRAPAERRWVRTTAEALRDSQGRVVKVVGNLIDVTDRRKTEEDRRNLEEQLRRSQRLDAIGKFAGGMAHDFNNLLTVILNSSEFALRSVKEQDPAYEDVSEIRKAAGRGAAVIRQLLAFSRGQVLRLEPIDLNQVATEMEQMLHRIIDKNIELEMKLAPNLGVTMADASQMEQVIVNLIVNARDAMPDGGKITVATNNVHLDEEACSQQVDLRPGEHVVLSVTDSGCGMEVTTQARVFEPFFTTREPGKGTGLGLSTVFGIVKQSGGHISVESEPGKGSTFRIYLPRETPRSGTPARGSSAPPQGSETVLPPGR